MTQDGINESKITIKKNEPIEGPRTESLFSGPKVMIREHMDLHCAFWEDYLTFKKEIVGFSAGYSASKGKRRLVIAFWDWLNGQKACRAFVAAVSSRLFTQKATAVSGSDILKVPYPNSRNLNLSPTEEFIVDDIVDYYRDLVRLGEKSRVMVESGINALDAIHFPNTTRYELFDFFVSELPKWRDSSDRPITDSETALTSGLCAHLSTAAHFSVAWNRA